MKSKAKQRQKGITNACTPLLAVFAFEKLVRGSTFFCV